MNDIFRKILNEGLYKGEDFYKHDFLYLNNVLNDFENKDFIYTRNDDNEVIELDIKNKKGDNFQKNIERFRNWLNSNPPINLSDEVGTVNNFLNKLSSKKGKELTKVRGDVLKNFKDSFGISFTEIEKKDPRIISTSEQESIQAIFLAARIKDDKSFYSILNSDSNWDKKCNDFKEKLYNNDLGIILKNDKINFSNKKNQDVLKKLVNILNIKSLEELSHLEKEDFTIIHPDGLKNTNNKVNNGEVAELTKVLFGNGIKWKVENRGFSLTLKKDNFIPADLYIIPLNKIKGIKEIIDMEGSLNPYSMVDLSNKLMGTKDEKVSVPLIYPISLKMPSDNPKIKKIINSKNENTIRVGTKHIEFIHFNDTGNSTMGIKYEGKRLVLEFRSKGEEGGKHKLWQCNAKNKDNTNAIEGGSAKNYMKFVFRDNMNGSIDEKDVKKIAEVFKSKITDKPRFSDTLAESFKRFFEDDVEEIDYNEEENELTLNDVENESSWNAIEKKVLLAVPGIEEDGLTIKRGESSAKEGCIGLGLFCKKLIENDIEKSLDYNEALSKIVQMSFKMNEIVQDTWKIT